MTADERARKFFDDYVARHARPEGLGCSTVAHRDLGFCASCLALAKPDERRLATATELSAWRLLAMAERGMVDWTAR